MMQPAKENWFIRLQKRYYAYVEREDQQLFERLKAGEMLQPRLTPGKVTAFMIATAIHSITILLPILALVMLITQFAGCFSVCYSIIFLGIAIVVRPRLNKLPDDIAKTEKFPALYRAVDQVADCLHAPPIDLIVINEFFNASYGRVGLRQSSLLTLGYPLWKQLTPQERIALIGHEMAHAVNQDFSRNFVVGGAIHSLAEWYNLLYPDQIAGSLPTHGGLMGALIRFFMWIVANIAAVWLLALRHLLFLESRRAEYLADHLAATVSGTDAIISVLQKLKYASHKTLPITTHPSIAYRIAMLEAKPAQHATVHFSEAETAKVDTEMSTLDREMAERIRNLRLYGSSYY